MLAKRIFPLGALTSRVVSRGDKQNPRHRPLIEEVAVTRRVVYLGYANQPVAYETRLFILSSRNALFETFAAVINMLAKRTFPLGALTSRVVSRGDKQNPRHRPLIEEVAVTGRVVYLGYANQPVAYETRLFVLGSRNALVDTPQGSRTTPRTLRRQATSSSPPTS